MIALQQINTRGGRGRGLAIAGLSVSILPVVTLLGLAGWAAVNEEGRDEATGEVTTNTRVQLDDLRVGDCVPDVEEGLLVHSLEVVPCAQPHRAEVFSVLELPASAFPGQDEVDEQAILQCDAKFQDYAPSSYEDETLELFYFSPTEETWKNGDRKVICVIWDSLDDRTVSVAD